MTWGVIPPLGPPRGHKAQNTIFEIFGLLRAQFWEPFREKNGQVAKSPRMPFLKSMYYAKKQIQKTVQVLKSRGPTQI